MQLSFQQLADLLQVNFEEPFELVFQDITNMFKIDKDKIYRKNKETKKWTAVSLDVSILFNCKLIHTQFKPKIGQTYNYFTGNMDSFYCTTCIWNNTVDDFLRLNSHNVFRSVDEALAHANDFHKNIKSKIDIENE